MTETNVFTKVYEFLRPSFEERMEELYLDPENTIQSALLWILYEEAAGIGFTIGSKEMFDAILSELPERPEPFSLDEVESYVQNALKKVNPEFYTKWKEVEELHEIIENLKRVNTKRRALLTDKPLCQTIFERAVIVSAGDSEAAKKLDFSKHPGTNDYVSAGMNFAYVMFRTGASLE